jgi:hypothetical protein
MTLDKLESIHGDLVHTDDDWQSWKFPNFIEALQKWTEQNPPRHEDKTERTPKDRRARSFHARDREVQPRPCVYCNSTQHKSVKCDKITTPSERKKHLSSNYASTALVPATELQHVAAHPCVEYVVRNIILLSVKKSKNKW